MKANWVQESKQKFDKHYFLGFTQISFFMSYYFDKVVKLDRWPNYVSLKIDYV